MADTADFRVYVLTLHPASVLTGREHFVEYAFHAIGATGAPVDRSLHYVARPDALNIVVDGFSINDAIAMMEARSQGGGEHIIVATEFLTDGTFNDIGQASGTFYDHKDEWRAKFEAFSLVAQRAKAIWVTTPHQIEGYREAFPDVPVLLMPLRFSRTWNHHGHQPPLKLYDIVFMGVLTDRRKALLERLSRSVSIYHPPPMTVVHYAHIASQAKVALHLRLKDEWPYTSPMRHLSLLHCDTYIVSEKCPLPDELDPFVERVAIDDLETVLQERLDDSDLALKAQRRKAAFMRHGGLKRDFLELLSASFD
ncbi:MAG: hypothetical protein NXI16_01635 [Alphaproteobacteria bacterium]|nr:hypothetical protein [Alphaproteobacteria bacterium]